MEPVIRALDHLDLVVTSLERSQPFYQELLGLTRASEIVGERGERVVYLSRPDEEPAGNFALGLREKQSDAHGVPFDRYAVGVHHVAFEVESRAVVDERAEWLRARGAEIESGPAEY
ncbi:MAG: VOC family protein, partial [Gaiellaceae bacterium]